MLKQSFVMALATLIALPVFASSQREESCGVTAEIVAQAVSARLDGQTPDQTKALLARDGSGITGIYKATIPPLVDMVFGFEESTLGETVVEDYKSQCLNF